MNRNLISLFSLGSLLFLLAGCAPQLAQTKYGDVEQQWQNYVHKSYKDWAPPRTPPPINCSSKTRIHSEGFEVDAVPAPALKEECTSSVDAGNAIALPEFTKKPTDPGSKTYTVQKGDTLWSISCKMYNDGSKWKQIQDANKDVLTSPEKIKSGLVLTIPPQ